MKYLLLMLSGLTCLGARPIENDKVWTGTPDHPGFAVVELFTSEGCSSCPAAEEVVAKLAGTEKNVFVLGFHVDYWNSLGWKDGFSNPSYSKRQQQYARIFGLSSVYTPQIVVNGAAQFVGNDERQLQKTIDHYLVQPSPTVLQVKVVRDADHTIHATCTVPGNLNGNIQMAIIQNRAVTTVRAGENSGRTLHHINIVRDFKTGSLVMGSAVFAFQLPVGLTAGECQLFAFLQDSSTGNIRAATATVIP